MTIDQAYKFCLFVANKEQRGSITPENFNMLAPIMQTSVVNDRLGNVKKYQPHDPVPSYGWGLNEKILTELAPIYRGPSSITGSSGNFTLPSDVLYVDSLRSSSGKLIKPVQRDELIDLEQSLIKAPTVDYPVFYRHGNTLVVSPSSIITITYTGIRRPATPKWNYSVVNNAPVYDPTGSQDFDVSELIHLEICFLILKAIGVNLADDRILAYSGMEVNLGT